MHKNIYIRRISAFPESLFPEQEGSAFVWKENLGWVRALSENEENQLKEPEGMKLPDRLHSLLNKAAEGLYEQPEMIIVGSSRGATESLEKAISGFMKNGNIGARVSPRTTAGSFSSMLAHRFNNCMGMEISQTCSSGLQAILNGMAWIQAGFCQKVWAGAAEAPLTPFTVEMMKKTGILWAGDQDSPPVHGKGTVLAEAAILLQIDTRPGPFRIAGWGAAMDRGITDTGVSREGNAYFEAMHQAIEKSGQKPDLVILHAPGTKLGDEAEIRALKKLFKNSLPLHWSTKSITGHSLGAAGLVSLYFAWQMGVNGKKLSSFPWPENARYVLINSMGFGGNAISIMIEISA